MGDNEAIALPGEFGALLDVGTTLCLNLLSDSDPSAFSVT
jgi:hypothetical protein